MKQKIFALFLILCGLCLNLKAETQGDIVGFSFQIQAQ